MNLHDALKKSTSFKKIEIDQLLFVEYTCDPDGPRAEIWSHTNYFTYVVSGKMTLKTSDEEYEIKAGESYFIRKGAFIIPQFFKEIFCDMIVFMPDDFIRTVIDKYKIHLTVPVETRPTKSVIPLHLDETLTQYYVSLFTYFQSNSPPSTILLKIKLEELIVNILTNKHNQELAAHFRDIYKNVHPSVREIMEENFAAGLTMSEFARLTMRSLSTFRRDFQQLYGMAPGEWLREKRLQLSRYLLETTTSNIEDIAYESGFRSRTHFIRCFKDRFAVSPHQMRQNLLPPQN